MFGWWTNRIRIEADNDKKLQSVSHYFDELLSDEQRAAKTEEQFFNWLDRSIAADTLQ